MGWPVRAAVIFLAAARVASQPTTKWTPLNALDDLCGWECEDGGEAAADPGFPVCEDAIALTALCEPGPGRPGCFYSRYVDVPPTPDACGYETVLESMAEFWFGRLLYLVRTQCVTSQYFADLVAQIETYHASFDAAVAGPTLPGSAEYLACLSGSVADAADRIAGKKAAVVDHLAALGANRSTAVVPFSPAASESRNALADDNWECGPDHIEWRPAMPGRDPVFELEMCATYLQQMVEAHVSEAAVVGMGCFRQQTTDRVVPFVLMDGDDAAALCPGLLDGFAAGPVAGGIGYGVGCHDVDDTTIVAEYVFYGAAMPDGSRMSSFFTPRSFSLSVYVRVGLRCMLPWFPRGTVSLSAPAGYAASPSAVGGDRTVTAVLTTAARQSCADACSAVPQCTGFLWETGLLCRLVVGAATPADQLPGISYRVRLTVDGLVPKTARTAAGETVYRQTRTVPARDPASGPWTVFGAARRAGIAAAGRDSASDTDRAAGFGGAGLFTDGSTATAPAGCGELCGRRPLCMLAVWLGHRAPCYFMYGLNPAAVRAADVTGAGPRCARRVAGFEPSAAETAAICGLTPGCAFVDGVCTDVAPPADPRSAVSAAPPGDDVPAVFLVPPFRKAAALGVPFGVSCEACSSAAATSACAEAADIVVPATVATLTAAAFAGCANLRRLTVMAPAPHFGPGALAGAPGLEKISFGTANCGPDAHHHCSGTADAGAFPSCAGPDPAIFGFATAVPPLADCAAPKCADCGGDGPFTWRPPIAMTSIEDSAFADCARLISVDLRDATDLTVLPANAFAGATQLATLHLGPNLVEIGAGAFSGAFGLTTITGGDVIDTIGTRAFSSTGPVRAMPAWPTLTSLGVAAFRLAGATAISTGQELETVPPSGFESSEVVHLEIGAKVKTVGVNACADCAQLRTVEIAGNALTSIGQAAFQGCVALETLVIPDPPIGASFTIGARALKGTTALANFQMPLLVSPRDFLTAAPDTRCLSEPGFFYLGQTSYYHCAGLKVRDCTARVDCTDATHVNLNGNAPETSFAFDASLVSLRVETDVTEIGFGAFWGAALQTVVFDPSDTPLVLGPMAFYQYLPALLDLSVRTASIGNFAFSESSIEVADLSVVTEIGESAFGNSRRLHTVTFGTSLASIGVDAFANCSALLRIKIPGGSPGVIEIGEYAFARTTGLRAVSLEGSTFTVDPTAFDGATSLDSFQTTRASAFSGAIPLPGCSEPTIFQGIPIGFCVVNGQFPTIPTVATPVLFPYPPAPVVDPAPPATRPVSLRAPIDCIPCDSVPGTVYDAGRSFIPTEIRTVGPSMLADCPRVTSVSVAETTRFETDPATNSWRSPVLTSFTVRAAPQDTYGHFIGTVPRCIMNLAGTLHGPANSVPEDTGTFTCVPCSTDPVTHDLTVPGNVRQIPSEAFADCDISGTLQFATPASEPLFLDSGAFLMDGGKLGTVVVPVAAIPRNDGLARGIGEDAFVSASLRSFLVAIPASENIPGLDALDLDYWTTRIKLAPTGCDFPGVDAVTEAPKTLAETVTLTGCGDAEAAIRAAIPGPQLTWSRLFGTCGCAAMAPGCFGALLDAATVVLPNATAAACGRGSSRIGPVYLDVDTVLLPGGLSDPFAVAQPGTLFAPDAPEGCVVSGSVRYPATASDGGACTICGHSETCSSPNEHFPGAAAALVAAAPAPVPNPPPRPPVGPPVDPLPSAGPELGIWLTVGGGSAIMLVFIGRAVWRRWGALRRSGVRYAPVPGAPAAVPL